MLEDLPGDRPSAHRPLNVKIGALFSFGVRTPKPHG